MHHGYLTNDIDVSQENNSKSPSPAEELRSEVDVLRSEVMNLREMLNGQITLFNDERRRWDDEKSKVSCIHT
jgi:hypothetical protein